jgi:predicted PurR-regulated permease PerM
LLSLIIATGVLFGLFSVLTHEISLFLDDVPAIQKNISDFLEKTQQWISDTFHFTKEQQQQAIQNAKSNGMSNVKTVAGTTLGFVTSSLATVALIPIYVFLFMYYRNHLIMFTIKVFDKKHSATVANVVSKIRAVVQGYVSGLLIETCCVAVLNSIGLLLIGAPYAILLGVIGAILNLIPYIGGLIAVVLTAIVTLSNTGDIYIALGSLGVYLVVQFIDNNFFVPRIIGSSVQLNALVSILAVLIGGSLCGIGGMFLSLPFVAICKVIFDNVEALQPWGSLLGDEESARWNLIKLPPSKKAIAKKTAKQKPAD